MISVIDIQNVSHHYGDKQALEKIELTIGDEWFGMIGPNGGGKSTLFRLLATLIPCQTGEIRWFGRAATEIASVRAKTGVVFQTLSLDKKLTARENLTYAGKLFGLSQVKNRVDELLMLLDIREPDVLVEKLSGGTKRRVDIARALMHRPKLLLLDEPSTGLDPLVRQELMVFLKQVRKEGVTVVQVTHHLDEASECDRVAFIDAGKVVSVTSPQEMTQKIEGMISQLQTSRPQELLQLFWENMGRAVCPT